MKKIIYTFGLATLFYLVSKKAYDKGIGEAIYMFMSYAETHPDQTFKEFLNEWERQKGTK